MFQMKSTETEVESARGELEILRKALKIQTRRCRRLVTEYTRRLQEKERQYQSEKLLREDQLAKVLRALLIFEARLKQEQKFISYQLSEKDYMIRKQNNEIKRLMSENYCKNCKTYYNPGSNFESLDSSSEYVITDYQSSNFESLDSSSETYATVSEKEYQQINADRDQGLQANKNKDSVNRKRMQHRKSAGTYFEILKMRNNNVSPFSNEDNTSNDYDNLESLPAESVSETLRDENTGRDEGRDSDANDSESCMSVSEYNTVVPKSEGSTLQAEFSGNNSDSKELPKDKAATDFKPSIKISNTIPVFDADNDANDNWYASASDPDDEEHRNVYRNNPVLECMNQILLQNINDSISSPPKTPNVERKAPKNKRVKFSDEEEKNAGNSEAESNYYETPIQKVPNFYETPQSIYSNDYEQILTKSNNEICKTFTKKLAEGETGKQKNNHVYIDVKPESEEKDAKIVRKNKILRTPPALPPKPVNLISKYKMKSNPSRALLTHFQENQVESEPDYCSISELNLPTKQFVKKISVVAEINAPNDLSSDKPAKQAEKEEIPQYDAVLCAHEPTLVASKSVEKLSIQLAKQTNIRLDGPKRKPREPEIPKLPQVSEIIIPDETETKQQDDRITCDNYVKNNSQILQMKLPNRPDLLRHPIIVGSSVSALISGFNKQLLNEIGQKDKLRTNKKPGFENCDPAAFEKFDLSQNFEEFKLDDCEIEEEGSVVGSEDAASEAERSKLPDDSSSTNVEFVRATNDPLAVPKLNVASLEQFRKQLQLQHGIGASRNQNSNTPTYEHFLECTGLSSKSILTPSRLLSNHKSMLKPKDVKLRSKATRSNGLEKQANGNGTIKYWSEPFI